MIFSDMMANENTIKSVDLKFNFIINVDKIIIEASCSNDTLKYVCEIDSQQPNISFESIK